MIQIEKPIFLMTGCQNIGERHFSHANHSISRTVIDPDVFPFNKRIAGEDCIGDPAEFLIRFLREKDRMFCPCKNSPWFIFIEDRRMERVD